jgi:hypothetical protein
LIQILHIRYLPNIEYMLLHGNYEYIENVKNLKYLGLNNRITNNINIRNMNINIWNYCVMEQ